MSRMPLTDPLTEEDRATQLLIKYKSGALVTQSNPCGIYPVTQTAAFAEGRFQEQFANLISHND